MEFNYVPQVVFSVVKEEPHFSVCVRQEDSDQVDHVDVLKFTEELRKGFVKLKIILFKDYLVLTAISRQADMDKPVPSICFRA